ncbi:chorismate synthase [Xylaria bambusicola]|uniref:chorismate synthase n=1 Tax=Xylaria bambusicola TaxID=326684 RepID=UPI0020076DAA|nr:chorismate synthase [Xylaria bambusicola]KAI0522031.1 chorismate synthase [Xylaria bambusicola]
MSTFGQFLRVTTYGESHCPSVGCIVDNFPPGVPVSEEILQPQISRRRPGQSSITTPRNEADLVSIQSGVEGGVTLGTPIAMVVKNQDFRPSDYKGSTMKQYPRPSHADFTYLEKYGVRASSGGGRSSARETIGRVAAGALCEHYLKLAHGIEIVAWVSSVGNIHHIPPTPEYPCHSHNPKFLQLLQEVTRETVDKTVVRCPDPEVAAKMEQCISDFRDRQDSIGGTVTCVIRNVPTGLGEPVFSKLEATLAHGMLSIPATKGFEIGSGFEGTEIPGSTHNDMFIRNPVTDSDPKNGFAKPKLTTSTNNSGGIQGGITNGAPIFFRVAFKSPATIGLPQETVTFEGESDGLLEAKGRHDPCVVPRAVPIVESMASICILDALLMQGGRRMAGLAR